MRKQSTRLLKLNYLVCRHVMTPVATLINNYMIEKKNQQIQRYNA